MLSDDDDDDDDDLATSATACGYSVKNTGRIRNQSACKTDI